MKHDTLKKKRRSGYLEIVLVVIFFAVIIIWFSVGFANISSSTSKENLNEATQSVKKAVTLCYSIEGSFPPNIQYLKDNYNLVINEDKYIVHYNVFASNVMPEVVLFSRN